MPSLFSRIWPDKGSAAPAPAPPESLLSVGGPPPPVDVMFRVAVVGAIGVGKSSVCRRYCQNSFSQHYQPTIGIESRMVKLASNSNSRPRVSIILEMIEIPYQERQGPHASTVLSSCDGALLVLDTTQNTSLQAVDEWMSELSLLRQTRELALVLLANKVDRESMAVPLEALECYTKESRLLCWETASAAQGSGVRAAMDTLVDKMIKELGLHPRGPQQITRKQTQVEPPVASSKHKPVLATPPPRYSGLHCTDPTTPPDQVLHSMLAAIELALLQLTPQLVGASEETTKHAAALREQFEVDAKHLQESLPQLHTQQALAVLGRTAVVWEKALVELEVNVATSSGAFEAQSSEAATYMLSSLALLFPVGEAAAEQHGESAAGESMEELDVGERGVECEAFTVDLAECIEEGAPESDGVVVMPEHAKSLGEDDALAGL